LWLGLAPTVSPLHYDLAETLLAQAAGHKRVLLFANSAENLARLYPHPVNDQQDRQRYQCCLVSHPHLCVCMCLLLVSYCAFALISPTVPSAVDRRFAAAAGSRIDCPVNPDLRAFPLFGVAPALQAVLAPGDLLFIPYGFEHSFMGLFVCVVVFFVRRSALHVPIDRRGSFPPPDLVVVCVLCHGLPRNP
jgi:hypothetical protein